MLIGSSQDDYVPLELARLEIPPSVKKNSADWNLYLKMIYNLTKKLD